MLNEHVPAAHPSPVPEQPTADTLAFREFDVLAITDARAQLPAPESLTRGFHKQNITS